MRTPEQEEDEANQVCLDVNRVYRSGIWRELGYETIEDYIRHVHIDYLNDAERQLRTLRRLDTKERNAR